MTKSECGNVGKRHSKSTLVRKRTKHSFVFQSLLLYAYVLFKWMYIYWLLDPLELGLWWLWAITWVLGIQPRSFARPTNTLNCWAISSASHPFFSWDIKRQYSKKQIILAFLVATRDWINKESHVWELEKFEFVVFFLFLRGPGKLLHRQRIFHIYILASS